MPKAKLQAVKNKTKRKYQRDMLRAFGWREFLECFGCNFKFVRRLLGGHWELWWVDVPVCEMVWHREAECTYEKEGGDTWENRPTPLCKGTAKCEDYRMINKSTWCRQCQSGNHENHKDGVCINDNQFNADCRCNGGC